MGEPKTMLIVDDPYDAREAPDPEAVRRWYTETLPVLAAGAGNRIGVVESGGFRAGDALAAGLDPAKIPCQMMLGGGPGSLTERPCGTTPTVGGNGLYRYCERHMRMAASAGATTLQRDANGTVTLSVTGTASSRTYATRPGDERKIIRCDNTRTVSTPTGKFDDNGDLVATALASIDRALAAELPGAMRIVPVDMDGLKHAYPSSKTVASIPRAGQRDPATARQDVEAWFAATAPTEGGPPPRHECPLCFTDLTPLNTWHHTVHLQGGIKTIMTCADASCVAWAQRVQDEADATRKRLMEIDTSGVPIGKAPQCGHQTLTAGCSVCAILREHLARVGARRGEIVSVIPGPAATLGALVESGHLDANGAWVADPVQGHAPAAPPPRPDGFSQAQVDAAKAVLLAPVTKRGGK